MPNPLRRLVVRWPQKLGALVLAVFVWLFVSSNDTSTTQRSVLVPVTVQGVATNEVVVGLADVVEVTFSGPSNQVERIEAADIGAVLDLSGVDGEFTEGIQIETPRGITLRRVEPTTLQGTVTSVTSRDLPLAAVPRGAVPADVRLEAQFDPTLGGEVSARGRREVLERVEHALVTVPTGALGESQTELTLRPFAVDAAGLPVPGIEFSPADVALRATLRPSLRRAELPLELASPGGGVEATLQQERIVVAGAPSALAGLERVRATVDPATTALPPGSYTLPVALQLPEGVAAESAPRAAVTIPAPARVPAP